MADFARDKTCKLRWSRTNGGLVKNQCRVYDSQIFVVGDYEKHECAIQGSAKRRALGCVNSPPRSEGARRRDYSRNLGTTF